MVQCPNCGAEHEEGLTACPACGHTYEEYTCSRCEEKFQGSDSCPACGVAREVIQCDTHSENEAEGRCVICGRAVCRVCRREDNPAFLCADHTEMTVIQGWAQVYTTTSEFEAQLVRDNLLAEGVDARIYSQKDRIFSVDLGELSIVRLLVPAWAYDRASEVIRDHMDRSGEVSFACPACGEAYEPGATICAECGASLVSTS